MRETLKRAAKVLFPEAHIRWMIRRDMEAVLAIERGCFARPATEDQMIEWLRNRQVIGMVIERDDQVRGFMIYQLHKQRMHLVDFAVDPAAQRTGLGRAMLIKLKDKLSPCRRTALTVMVRESNLPAQLFLRAQGFRCRGIQAGCCASDNDEPENGYFFSFTLEEESCNR